MKVYIGPYKNWFGPYQLAEKILFWKDPYDDTVMKLGERLEFTYPFFVWLDSLNKRKVKIRIDNYDSWNAFETIGLIVLPILKQLAETKQGSPRVDLSDVPKHLHPEHNTFKYEVDVLFHKRWEYVLNEMIYAFESLYNNWEWKGDTYIDVTSPEYKQEQERIQNGFRLFGKYYQDLWI